MGHLLRAILACLKAIVDANTAATGKLSAKNKQLIEDLLK